MSFVKPLRDQVTDEELLYRSVKKNQEDQPPMYSYFEAKLRISASAFNDKSEKPSVDRALLNDNDPTKTKKSITDGVIVLLAKEVRGETVNTMTADGKAVEISYRMDIQPDPLTTNLAHAVIIANPQYKNSNAFRKIKERLAFLASQSGWTIEPG